MKLIRGLTIKENIKEVVATIGNFDGVHLGHQDLLKRLKQKALALNLPLVVILFEPQPLEYFLKEKAPARLSSLRDKLYALKKSQVDYVCCIAFNEKLSQTKAQDFANNLFTKLKIKYLLVGEDFRFGKNREGDIHSLKALGQKRGIEVACCPDWCLSDDKVSSTKIRQALEKGQLELGQKLLGKPYSLCGRIIRGDGRGRQWGIPTANVRLKSYGLALKGVYVVEAHLGNKAIRGVANIGKRPTVDGTKNSLEVHLFDFDQSIYGQFLQVFFLHKLRDEVKFTTVEALITQINHDINLGKAYFHQAQSTL